MTKKLQKETMKESKLKNKYNLKRNTKIGPFVKTTKLLFITIDENQKNLL